MPEGFEAFPTVDTGIFGAFQGAIDLNKNGLLFVMHFLENNLHIETGSAGLAILIWTLALRMLTTPLYEVSVKEPAKAKKAIMEWIQANLLDSEGKLDNKLLKSIRNADSRA